MISENIINTDKQGSTTTVKKQWYLIGYGDVGILAKCVALGESCCSILDQIECPQLPKRHEQLFDLKRTRQFACCPRVDLQNTI